MWSLQLRCHPADSQIEILDRVRGGYNASLDSSAGPGKEVRVLPQAEMPHPRMVEGLDLRNDVILRPELRPLEEALRAE